MTRALGWPYRFRVELWADIEAKYAELEQSQATFGFLRAIAISVRASPADRDLVGFTSMHDLMVRSTPVPGPPYDLVAVRTAASYRQVRSGTILVEHISTTGRDERIVRPLAEAVPLFWRFMIEKYGIDPMAAG